MTVKRAEMVIRCLGMLSSKVFSKTYLEGIPFFRQPILNFTSDVAVFS